MVDILEGVLGNAENNFILYFSQWMLLVAIIGSLGLLIALMVYRQETPTNYILLALFVSTCTFLFLPLFGVCNLSSFIICTVIYFQILTL
jgi:uncharacterized membrane protein